LGYVVIAILLGAGVASATQYAYTSIDYPGATYTYAYGINASGQIVGIYLDKNDHWHGFIATPKTSNLAPIYLLMLLD
jgi:hypothetical protein